jgi:hypothetical protein
MPEPEWLTVAEAAKRSGYTARHVQYLLKQGLLKGRKPARDWFVDSQSLTEYLRNKPKPGPKPGDARRTSD